MRESGSAFRVAAADRLVFQEAHQGIALAGIGHRVSEQENFMQP
jgi:hypothetical protein